MKQTTKNVIALIFVILCAVVLVVLLTPPEFIPYIKRIIEEFLR